VQLLNGLHLMIDDETHIPIVKLNAYDGDPLPPWEEESSLTADAFSTNFKNAQPLFSPCRINTAKYHPSIPR